jgi:hypothetical protein
VDLLPEADPVKPLIEATEQARLAAAQEAAGERNADMERERDRGEEPSLASGVISNFFDR